MCILHIYYNSFFPPVQGIKSIKFSIQSIKFDLLKRPIFSTQKISLSIISSCRDRVQLHLTSYDLHFFPLKASEVWKAWLRGQSSQNSALTKKDPLFLDTTCKHQHRFSPPPITRRFNRRRSVSVAWSVFSNTCTRTCCSSFVRHFRYHVPPSPPSILRNVGNSSVTANPYQDCDFYSTTMIYLKRTHMNI